MLHLLKDQRALALLLAASLTILSNTLISPALPGIEAHFAGASNAGFLTRLLVTAPSLMVAIAAPVSGHLADRFGRRRQLLFGAFLFAAFGTAGMWLPTLPLILASRLVLGVSVALIMTAHTALIADYFSGPDRARFMGLQLSVTNFGGLLFLLVSGALAGLTPFAPFAIYGVALLYLPLFWVALHEPAPARAHAAMPLSDEPGEPGWQMAVTAIVFLAVTSMLCLYILPTQAPYFLAEMGLPEPSMTALFLGVVTFAGGLASLTFSRVREGLGRAKTSAFGFGLFAMGFALLALAGHWAMAFTGAMVSGLAIGYLMPVFLSIGLDVAPAHHRGRVAGIITASIFFGQFLSPVFSQPLIGSVGFSAVFGIAAFALCFSALVSLWAFRGKDAGLPA